VYASVSAPSLATLVKLKHTLVKASALASHFHPILIFAGKAKGSPLGWSTLRCYAQIGFSRPVIIGLWQGILQGEVSLYS